MPISTIGTNSLSATAQIGSLTTASGSAPSYSARAWVNFNGTGTVAIRASGNVTSITDNGTGNYTVNLTNAVLDTNYAAVATSPRFTQTWGTRSTTQMQVTTQDLAGNNSDQDNVQVAVFR